VWQGIWWSVVTITTTGYGDKVPITVAGRLFSFLWMINSLVFLSVFGGMVSSAIIIGDLSGVCFASSLLFADRCSL
jgi:polar amino acid transport system substrate-binding protein